MRRLPRAAALVSLGLALTACSSSTKPSASPTPTVSPSASPAVSAAVQLARLAALSAKSSYSASYTVTGAHPGRVYVLRTPSGYRFELATGAGKTARRAMLIRTTAGTVSCTVVPTPVTCLKVAGPGKGLPAVFDAGLQHVFSDYLVLLSRVGADYTVTEAIAGSAGGQCFDVSPVASPAPTGAVAAGTYCFGPDGVPTRVTYPSGSLVLLARGPAPKAKDFVPPVAPRPLP